MIPVKYLNKVRGILEHLETTQLEAVDAAADFIVNAWDCGGVIYCHKFGHGIEGDSRSRAGGLVSVKSFDCLLRIRDAVPECLEKKRHDPERDLKEIRAAISLSKLRENDVLFLSSVSGRNRGKVEMALACRDKGVRTVSFSSLAYSSRVESEHPSGKKLCEVSDVNIDIGAPYGDAAVDIPGIEVKVMPVSGVSMACSAWMIWGRAMEKAAADGKPPSVLISHNSEGGPEYNEKSKKIYEKRGY